MKRVIITLIKFIITFGLFVLLFWPETFGLSPNTFGGIKPSSLINEIRSLNPSHAIPWILFALFIRLGGIMCGVIRWKILLNGQNLYIPFSYMTQSWFIGRTVGIFLPSTIGLDGYRLYDSVRYTGDIVRCTTVIFIEKIIGFISLTTLVFLTFPLGFRLLKFNTLILLIILLILGLSVFFFLSLLIQPYIIQFILYSIPVPQKVKNLLNRLGSSATAYAGHRKYLLLAILCGLAVHLSACFMYFGTMMALRSENTSLWDVLFASPLMIYGTVLGPSIGGEGIREIVFATLLGGKENTLKVVAFAHLGWWIGDVVPFLIGLPFLIFRKRPQKEEIQRQMQNIHQSHQITDTFSAEINVDEYHIIRNQIVVNIIASILGSVTAGSMCGLCESLWITHIIPNLKEYQLLWWSPLIYGIASIAIGISVGIFICSWIPLLIRSFPSSAFSYSISFFATLLSLGLFLILWRYYRDILFQKPASYITYLPISLYSLGGMIIISTILYTMSFYLLKMFRKTIILVSLILAIIPTLLGFCIPVLFSLKTETHPISLAKAPQNAPNIILIIADALRADYLPMYNPSIETVTPTLNHFVEQSILFMDCSAQASWTKPSFASIYTGTIPSRHHATSKNAVINPELPTLAEVLFQHGYYTKGYANNPNVYSIFGFDKGFVEYTELETKRALFAKASSSKLTIYEILRRVHGKIYTTFSKLLKRPPDIKGYYQPAEAVTSEAVHWLNNRPYKENPFYLVLHYMDTHDPYLNRNNSTFFARALLGNTPKSALTPPMREAYISEIEHLDKHLGTLFNELSKLGLDENTYIIFTADHGEEFEDHNGWWHGFTLYQEMLHVPLIIKVPKTNLNNAPVNKRISSLVRLIDIPPTILEVAGIESPNTFEGKSLLTQGGDIAESDNNIYTWAENEIEGQIMQSVRNQQFKLILSNPENPRGLKPEELYDLNNDSKELQNLSHIPDFKQIKDSLMNIINEIKNSGSTNNITSQPKQVSLPTELQEKLKAIGYME